MAIETPVLEGSITGTTAAIELTGDDSAGVTHYLKYQQKGGSAWSAGGDVSDVGEYTFNVSGLTVGLEYVFIAYSTFPPPPGVTYGERSVDSNVLVLPVPSGDYTSREELNQVFGSSNINKWADLDNDGVGSKITARISKAIAYAESEVNSRLRDFIYVLPVASSLGVTPEDIVQIATLFAGVWLYEARGVEDFDQETGRSIHRLGYAKKRASSMLNDILVYRRKLDAVLISDTETTYVTTAPAAGEDEDDD